jgi:hypothetical protein
MANTEALRIAVAQDPFGVWNGNMLATPAAGSRKPEGSIGTISAVHRLLEIGWESDASPFQAARRPLFRLLAEDADPSVTYELAATGRDSESVIWSRAVLRGASAAALAHAGYELDPRLRGAAQRLLGRVDEFISSPLAEDPWVKFSGTEVLSPDAFLPSFHILWMLSHMPSYQVEHDDLLDRLATYFGRPQSRHASRQQVGTRVLANPWLLSGDPLAARSVVDDDLMLTLYWLELAARLGLLKRHEGWSQLLSRLLDMRDRDLVWRHPKGTRTEGGHDITWPWRDVQGRGSAGLDVEVTFRLALIARLAGYTVDFV